VFPFSSLCFTVQGKNLGKLLSLVVFIGNSFWTEVGCGDVSPFVSSFRYFSYDVRLFRNPKPPACPGH